MRTISAFLGFAILVCLSLPAPTAAQGVGNRRAAPEMARGGLTIAEQAARERELHEEIAAIVPPGVVHTPLSVGITQKDLDDLAEPFPSGSAPLRIGVVKSVPRPAGKPFGKAFNHGVGRQNVDGSFEWAMTVTSPGAQAIRVHFTGFSLPENTEMFFLGPNGQAHGPYVGQGRNGDGDFWTRSIVSDTGTVVLSYSGDTPADDRPKVSFTVSDVGHIRGRPPRPQEQSHDTWPCSDNAPCVVDVNCANTGPAAPAEDAVAKMEWITEPYINTCSGGLLADTDSASQIPYFLTANHCVNSDISNLETFFNYTTDSCRGSCPDSLVTGGTPPPASTVGVTVVATGGAGDYTLVTLDEAPPAGATFLGWNNSPIAYTHGASLYRISNADFGPQVYSQHDVTTTSPTCAQWPLGERIYSEDQTGATMGGSSGSPALNSASEVVGQLSGCCGFNCGNDCDSVNNWTVDGALAFYWIPFPSSSIHNLRVRATRSVTTDSSAPGPRLVSAERVSRVATPALAAKHVTRRPTHAMCWPATTTEPARRANTAVTVRTTADGRPTGILAAGIAATVTCPIAAIRGVPRAAGLAVPPWAAAQIATMASSATAPRSARVGVARAGAIRAQARAAMRVAISAWRAGARGLRAVPTAIAAPTTARTALARATSSEDLGLTYSDEAISGRIRSQRRSTLRRYSAALS